jgi:hypothetical protein
MEVPVLNNDSENWKVNWSSKRKIKSAEIKSVIGYFILVDFQRSTEIQN